MSDPQQKRQVYAFLDGGLGSGGVTTPSDRILRTRDQYLLPIEQLSIQHCHMDVVCAIEPYHRAVYQAACWALYHAG